MQHGGGKDTKYEAFIGKANLTIKDFIKGLRINLSASRKAGYSSEATVKRTLCGTIECMSKNNKNTKPNNSLNKEKSSNYHDDW